MTCKDVMTGDPACCLPADSVSLAAQIMKREDIGPVLVVTNHEEKRLAGIVTDRDLAIQVVAEGRDPHGTRVDQVMSTNTVTCRDSDDVSVAIRKMSANQVRRLPVIDAEGRLCGIIAQADIARHSDDEEDVAEMVEEISQPFGSDEWISGGRGVSAWGSAASSFAKAAVCIAAGASLMYVIDSRRERALHGSPDGVPS
jgi:CBS domain-containing protein